jgi:hypothetical protein
MNTSFLYVILINAYTYSSIGKICGSLRMRSTSHKELKFFINASLLELPTCIMTIKNQYYAKTYFAGESIEI